jgi:hypothetical protein
MNKFLCSLAISLLTAVTNNAIMLIRKREKFIILMVIIISFSSCISTGTKEFSYFETYHFIPKDTELTKYIPVEKGFVAVYIERYNYYYLENRTNYVYAPLICYKKFGEQKYELTSHTSKYININNKPTTWSREAVSPNIKLTEKGGYEILEYGLVTFKVTVGDQSVTMTYNTELLPIKEGMTYDEVILTLGYPDEEEKGVVDTWTSKYGSADLDDRYHSYWNLIYNKYGGIKIRLTYGGKVETLDYKW